MDWSQISGARTIVEATLPDMNVELSQGSHFFHNLSSFRASYFMVRHDGPFPINWDWLNRQPVVSETELVRHVRPARPLSVRVDGRIARGVVLARARGHAGEKQLMNRDETQVGIILHELQERAKELNCLYRVDELLNQLRSAAGGHPPRHRGDSSARLAVSARLPGTHRLRRSGH